MSRGDSTLAMLLKIESDPSQATTAIEELRVQIESLTAQVTAQQSRIEELSQGHRHLSSQSTEARHALHGMGEELGIHMPRFVRSFITEIEGVGPALASAFSVIAIIGIAQMLEEQLPKAWDKLSEKITGWGEKAKKEYEGLLDQNRKLEEGLMHFQMRLNEAMGKGPEENLKIVEERMVETRKKIVETNKAIEEGVSFQWVMGTMVRKEIADMDELKRTRHALLKTEADLGALFHKLSEERVIDQVKETEETRKWFGHKIEESYKFQENQSKHEKANLDFIEGVHRQIKAEETAMFRTWAEESNKTGKAMVDTMLQVNENIARAIIARYQIQKEGQKDVFQETLKLQEGIDAAAMRTARQQVKDIIERSKLEIEEEHKAADAKLKVDELYLTTRLHLHQISGTQFNRQSQMLLEQWKATHDAILNRQLNAAKAVYGQDSAEYAKLIHHRIGLDGEYSVKHEEAADRAKRADQQQMDSVLSHLSNIAGALQNHHNLEMGLIITRATIKIAESVADSVRAFALGDFRAGALHALAAVDYAVVARSQAAGGRGGGAAAGGGGAGGGPAGGPAAGGPVAMAPGAQAHQQPLHVVIMGQGDQAQYFAKMLNTGVRTQGVQLAATHAADGTVL